MVRIELTEHRQVLLTSLFIVVLLIGVAVYPLFYDRVYDGVVLDDINIQGKTLAELTEEVKYWDQQSHGKQLLLYFEDTVFVLTSEQVNFAMQVDRTVADAWQYGRTGSWWKRVQDIRYAREHGQGFQPYITYDQAKLEQIIDEWKKKLERGPKNATLSMVTGGIIPEERGRKLRTEGLIPQIVKAFYHPDTHTVQLPVVTIEPPVTTASLTKAGIVTMQSVFSTTFDLKDINRSANVALAAEKINGTIVEPGQIFSFNDVVGPRDKANGFREAMEIFDSEMVPGIGGGVCQVSSTLYNAVLLANLQSKERWNHGRPLSYVGMGRDATVVYGAVDFKFINNTDSPVMILAEVKGNELTVAVFGREKLKETIDIEITDLKELPFKTVKKNDPLLPVGQVVQHKDKKGAPGYEMNVFRVITIDRQVVKREFLGKDRYVPENVVIKVGTKKPAVQPEKVKPEDNTQSGQIIQTNPANPLNPAESGANDTSSKNPEFKPVTADTGGRPIPPDVKPNRTKTVQ